MTDTSPSQRTDAGLTDGAAAPRDHGGGLDAAVARFGGARGDWIDLSTGINPCPWPVADMLARLPADVWTALPDQAAITGLERAARRLWSVPDHMAVLAAPGASALIARIPALATPGTARIAQPSYNEHAAAFAAHGWRLAQDGGAPARARVIVHPNNPTGQWYTPTDLDAPLMVVDESFCDVAPERSLLPHAPREGAVILKSFGKFWGLAGLRLGFAIGDPAHLARLAEWMGPWPVSGPALAVGTAALSDLAWAEATRARLAEDAQRLDRLMIAAGAKVQGGTDLFRLYEVDSAAAWQARLAEWHIWSRIFPWSGTLIRLGLPAPEHWSRIEAAL